MCGVKIARLIDRIFYASWLTAQPLREQVIGEQSQSHQHSIRGNKRRRTLHRQRSIFNENAATCVGHSAIVSVVGLDSLLSVLVPSSLVGHSSNLAIASCPAKQKRAVISSSLLQSR